MVTYSEFINKYDDLSREAKKYNRPEFSKVYEIIKELTKGMPNVEDKENLELPLATGAIIDEALDKSGYSKDKAFVSDFKKYREVEQKTRELKLQGWSFEDNPENQALQNSNTDSWQFVSIKIMAPPHLMKTIDEIIDRDLKAGEGFFKNITEIPAEDEEDDDFFMIESYDIKCSLESYYRELQSYKVIERLLSDTTHKKLFLSILKKLAIFIKENTTTPNKIRNRISHTIKDLDQFPAIGLIWQILLLQGLCKWIEDIDIENEDENENEVQNLYYWLKEHLIAKEITFCYFFWSDEEKEALSLEPSESIIQCQYPRYYIVMQLNK